MMTDPIADMLTRIRNANAIERPAVEMPASGVKISIAKVLKEEGFILTYELGRYEPDEEGYPVFSPDQDLSKPKMILRLYLKYGPEGEKVIRKIDRYSKPGLRVYRNSKGLPRVLDGLGIAVISTSKGVMSDRQARKQGVGGEILCTVW